MTVRVEKNDAVWTIIYSRPEARNAMTPENAAALYSAFKEFDSDSDAKVAVFWGEGGYFCAGWDLTNAASLTDFDSLDIYDYPDDSPSEIDPPMAPMGLSRLELSKPVIAAIAGPAVAGGMELAMWADIRVMEESAFMGVFCRRWGVPLVDGGTVRLPRLVGEGRALDLILTGRKVDAQEAKQIGLCEYVVTDGTSRQKAEELALQISQFPQSCMLADRRSMLQQHSMSLSEALKNEWNNSKPVVIAGVEGAKQFVSGKGRSGDFKDI